MKAALVSKNRKLLRFQIVVFALLALASQAWVYEVQAAVASTPHSKEKATSVNAFDEPLTPTQTAAAATVMIAGIAGAVALFLRMNKPEPIYAPNQPIRIKRTRHSREGK